MSVDFVLSFPCRFICFLISASIFFSLALFSFLLPSFRFFHFYAHQCTDFFSVSLQNYFPFQSHYTLSSLEYQNLGNRVGSAAHAYHRYYKITCLQVHCPLFDIVI